MSSFRQSKKTILATALPSITSFEHLPLYSNYHLFINISRYIQTNIYLSTSPAIFKLTSIHQHLPLFSSLCYHLFLLPALVVLIPSYCPRCVSAHAKSLRTCTRLNRTLTSEHPTVLTFTMAQNHFAETTCHTSHQICSFASVSESVYLYLHLYICTSVYLYLYLYL